MSLKVRESGTYTGDYDCVHIYGVSHVVLSDVRARVLVAIDAAVEVRGCTFNSVYAERSHVDMQHCSIQSVPVSFDIFDADGELLERPRTGSLLWDAHERCILQLLDVYLKEDDDARVHVAYQYQNITGNDVVVERGPIVDNRYRPLPGLVALDASHIVARASVVDDFVACNRLGYVAGFIMFGASGAKCTLDAQGLIANYDVALLEHCRVRIRDSRLHGTMKLQDVECAIEDSELVSTGEDVIECGHVFDAQVDTSRVLVCGRSLIGGTQPLDSYPPARQCTTDLPVFARASVSPVLTLVGFNILVQKCDDTFRLQDWVSGQHVYRERRYRVHGDNGQETMGQPSRCVIDIELRTDVVAALTVLRRQAPGVYNIAAIRRLIMQMVRHDTPAYITHVNPTTQPAAGHRDKRGRKYSSLMF